VSTPLVECRKSSDLATLRAVSLFCNQFSRYFALLHSRKRKKISNAATDDKYPGADDASIGRWPAIPAVVSFLAAPGDLQSPKCRGFRQESEEQPAARDCGLFCNVIWFLYSVLFAVKTNKWVNAIPFFGLINNSSILLTLI